MPCLLKQLYTSQVALISAYRLDSPVNTSTSLDGTFMTTFVYLEGTVFTPVLCRFMSTGLYQFSRHPNYFGEIMVWVALYGLAAYPRIWRVHPWVALSPLFTAFLLLKVSGKAVASN